MKTKTPFDEIAAIDRELTEIAPRVRQGFVCLGGPSERVEQAIRDEARRAAALRMRSAWPRITSQTGSSAKMTKPSSRRIETLST